jgi:ATP-binding cassette, subfamily C, bacterial CydD
VSDAVAPQPGQLLTRWMRPHRWWLHGAWIAGLGAGLATIAVAGLVAHLIHETLLGPADPALAALLLPAAGAVVLRHGLQAVRDVCGQRLAEAVQGDLRSRLIAFAARTGPVGMARRGHTGEWASRYQDQADALGGYYARFLPARLLTVLVPAVILVTVFRLDWLAGTLLLLATPLIPAFMALIGMGSEQVHARHQEEQNRLAGHFLDRIRNLDLLRRSRALAQAETEVAEAADRYRQLTLRVLRVAFLSSAVMEFFSAVAIGLLAIYIGFGLLGFLEFGPAPGLTLFSGLFILLLAPEYFSPLRQFAHTYHDRAGALAAAQALAPLVDDESATVPAAARDTHEGGPLLRLEGVTVRPEPGAEAAIRDLSLDIEPGERVALAGPSGSGKSTLLAVCAGFMAIEQGRISARAEARAFAWIGQRAHLFHGSVRDNLLLASREPASDRQLAAALEAAGLPLDDPALPDGLDTLIGEGNRGLSGGQAQRVALARALLSGSRLWLLDEPTSALDPATERALLDTLLHHARSRGITVIMASHQPEVQAHFPRIVRLRAGRSEADTHV